MGLKKRLIPVMLLDGGRLTKTIGFGPGRDVGDPVKSAKVYNDQYADELVFLDITRDGRSPVRMAELLERVSAVSFMPLALGGGITSSQDARILIQGGADKVVVNSAFYRDPGLVRGITEEFGSQALIAGIDCRRDAAGGWRCCSDCGRRDEGIDPISHAQSLEAAGAGEILIQSIDHDGAMAGYDVPLLTAVAAAVRIPVIGLGGAGHYEHLAAAFQASGVEALAMGSLFNFSDSNPLRAKAFLTNLGLDFKVV